METSRTKPIMTPAVSSPEYVRLSLAAAMTLGFVKGWFHRGARLGCINLLLTYPTGCSANCSFCGLARDNGTGMNFIRVPWRAYRLDEVLERIADAPEHVSRVCISMITNPAAREDVLRVCSRVDRDTSKAVSLLISPTLVAGEDLVAMKDSGAERIGVAVDGATEAIFNRYRGKPVKGPHRWEKYWRVFQQSIEVFGVGMAGVHLICGLGETEQEMVQAINRAATWGGRTHLFSFFAERGSALEHHPQPQIGSYRRVQLTRWLIDHGRTGIGRMGFDNLGKIRDFGVPEDELAGIVSEGAAFETSGCPGPDGTVACNRPFGNEKPGQAIRNFPFPPNQDDIRCISAELKEY